MTLDYEVMETSSLKVIDATPYRRSEKTNRVVSQPHILFDIGGREYYILNKQVLYSFLKAHDYGLTFPEFEEWCYTFDLKQLVQNFTENKKINIGVWLNGDVVVDVDRVDMNSEYFQTAFEMISANYFSDWSSGARVATKNYRKNNRVKLMSFTHDNYLVEVVAARQKTHIIGRYAYGEGYLCPLITTIDSWVHLADEEVLGNAIHDTILALTKTGLQLFDYGKNYFGTKPNKKINASPVMIRARMENEIYQEFFNSFNNSGGR